ncbi:MAG TPA: hypothetical protein VGF45_23735, partial [Polyangia bacterium]
LGQQFPGARLGGVAIDVDPARPGEARIRYSFVDLALGAAADGAHTAPPFFSVGAGRRYATASARRTSLLLGPEIPLELDAEITLPRGSRVLHAGRGGEVVLSGAAGHLRETRAVVAATDTSKAGPTIRLQRSARLPLTRVSVEAYQTTAAALRRMDVIERDDIRIALPASSSNPP